MACRFGLRAGMVLLTPTTTKERLEEIMVGTETVLAGDFLGLVLILPGLFHRLLLFRVALVHCKTDLLPVISENLLLLLEGVTARKFLCQFFGDLEVWVHDFLEATPLVAVSVLTLLLLLALALFPAGRRRLLPPDQLLVDMWICWNDIILVSLFAIGLLI